MTREEEILQSQGHRDPKIRSILDQLAGANEAEALELALVLQKEIRGDAALLNRPEAGEAVARLRAEAAERDRVMGEYDENQERFVQDRLDRAERLLKKTGAEADRIKARVSQEFNEAVQAARGRQGADRMRLEELLKNSPKEEVYVEGTVVMSRQGESIIPVVMGEQINMKHLRFYLKPGQHVVPKPIADILRQRRQLRLEQAAREKALQATGEAGRDVKVFQEWDRIDREFGSKSQKPQIVGLM